jgi:hypothetical protein
MASAVHAAAEPLRHVFHVVIAPMYLLAFRVWFARRPPPAAARRARGAPVLLRPPIPEHLLLAGAQADRGREQGGRLWDPSAGLPTKGRRRRRATGPSAGRCRCAVGNHCCGLLWHFSCYCCEVQVQFGTCRRSRAKLPFSASSNGFGSRERKSWVYMAKQAVPARHGTSTIRHDTKQHDTMSCSCLAVPCHFGLPCQG